jgi:M-phase inducer tyrosine phosphatase
MATEPVTAIQDKDFNRDQMLPTLPASSTDWFWRISAETLIDCIDGKFTRHFDRVVLIDCRFRYEYDGGHIDGAISLAPKSGSITDTNLLNDLFSSEPNQKRTAICLYCEFSQLRAPLVAESIRSKDRRHHMERFPALTYPWIYVLDGGYNGFFAKHVDRCVPETYIRMTDTKYRGFGEDELYRLKQTTRLKRSRNISGL